jgi:starch-binding outer membrane protein, SusD/RagB family
MHLFRIMYKWVVAIPFVAGLPLITGCNKLLDAGTPDNKVVTPQVYKSDSRAQAAFIGVYFKIMENFGPFNGYMSRFPGLSCDELSNGTSVLTQDQPFLTNTLSANNNTIWQIWTTTYFYIYQCNDLVEGLSGNHFITPGLRDQLLGEAYFLRAFSYFYLVNLYGEVPLVLNTDYTKSASIPRTPVEDVYGQMIKDLTNAQDLLQDAYVTTPEYPAARVRVNRLAVKALLARIYLYHGEWANAAAAATEVIQSGIYQLETNLAQTFLYNSREAILQFMPVSDIFNTAEGSMFVPANPNGRPAIILSDTIIKYMEPADKRKAAWVRTVTVSGKPYNSPYKYKLNSGSPREEYNMVLRLAEQYCIRAEARAMLDQLPEAVNDLNTIRKRAGLPNLANITTQTQALVAVEQERRMEFFAEWGHRWFDLKRWPASRTTHPDERRVDEIMRALRPATWKTTAAFWPIPSAEIIRNQALTQNDGYN